MYSDRPYAGLFRSQGERYTPKAMPRLRAASEIARTTSPLPERHELFATEWSVVLVGHRQKPSWCLQVRITPRIPASAKALTMASASKAVGLKTPGSSSPYPHSLLVKV